jgi:hypothetical protein
MKIDAKISLLFGEDGLRIELVDEKSGVAFFRGKINAEQTCQALSRLARVPIESADVHGLDVVGKTRESKTITAIMPKSAPNDKAAARVSAASACPEGWAVSDNFSSQGTFFSEHGVPFVRFNVVRWIEE